MPPCLSGMLIPSIDGPETFAGAFPGFLEEGLAALFPGSPAGFVATLVFGFFLAAGFAGIGMDMPGIDCAVAGASRAEAAIEPQISSGRSFKAISRDEELHLRRLAGGAS